MIFGLILNAGLLFAFKYLGFVIESIGLLLGEDHLSFSILLPIGISFFTFQGMSYIIDVYRKNVSAQKNILKLGLFIALFPQLIAGPIVRYKDIADEIESRHQSLEDFAAGTERFIIGLGKKAIISNTLAVVVDSIWQTGTPKITCLTAWVGSLTYTLHIYFDFSGYSDMAIGLGRMFGFHFCENFCLPYTASSITEFWKRWHISLSSWVRDYVYIPLGGNRKHVYRNIAIVFLMTGIWHGASWNYIVWGLWNGFFVLIERMIKNASFQKHLHGEKWRYRFLGKIYTLFVVNLGWVLFRAPNLISAFDYIECMLGVVQPIQPGFKTLWYVDRWAAFIIVLGIVLSSSILPTVEKKMKEKALESVLLVPKYIVLAGIMFLSMIRIVSGTYNPFIYFRF